MKIERKEKRLEQRGSSETIRRTTSTFLFSRGDNLSGGMEKDFSEEEQKFLQWFVGFTEGDGSFTVDYPRRRLYFTINKRDPEVLHEVQQGLGFGSVVQYPSQGGCWRFFVSDQQGVDRLIHLFNGNLLLEKVSARFSRWLQARNSFRPTLPPIHRKRDPILTPILLHSTGWLSGLIQGERCFSISVMKDTGPVFRSAFALPWIKRGSGRRWTGCDACW
uniref:Putative site-specific DNA endonuclease n=1 Tax=Botryococcus braunii Showa TaxID=1202541 RepID=A0A167RKT5_BOTBR|nr:putative site-specific DNA endonuclease [Botryococcus braunii Showa]